MNLRLMSRGELFDLARVVAWAVLVPVAYVMGWLQSVIFVSLLSLWALVESAWAAFRTHDDYQDRLRRIEAKLDELLERAA